MKILQQPEQVLTIRLLLILEFDNMWKNLIKKNSEKLKFIFFNMILHTFDVYANNIHCKKNELNNPFSV